MISFMIETGEGILAGPALCDLFYKDNGTAGNKVDKQALTAEPFLQCRES
jgi:hypothetical protein